MSDLEPTIRGADEPAPHAPALGGEQGLVTAWYATRMRTKEWKLVKPCGERQYTRAEIAEMLEEQDRIYDEESAAGSWPPLQIGLVLPPEG